MTIKYIYIHLNYKQLCISDLFYISKVIFFLFTLEVLKIDDGVSEIYQINIYINVEMFSAQWLLLVSTPTSMTALCQTF